MTAETNPADRDDDRQAAPAHHDRAVGESGRKALSPAARRALAEAAERREQAAARPPAELHGRGGLEPVRYGDWEVNGLASDF